MTAPETKKALAERQAQELAALNEQFAGEAAGEGFEEADRDSYAVPFLKLLQDLSPEVDRKKGTAIEGAQSGMLYNTATGALFPVPPGALILPVHFSRCFLHWQPRDEGGGFLGRVSVAEVADMKTRPSADGEQPTAALWLEDGTYLMDTREHYCLAAPWQDDGMPETLEMAVISMASTQIKVSKRWMSAMQARKIKGVNGQLVTPPMYSRFWRATNQVQSRDTNAWYLWNMTPAQDVTSMEIVNMARGFREAILSGEAKAAEPEQGTNGEAAGGDIPF
jgi:hypothetical protein